MANWGVPSGSKSLRITGVGEPIAGYSRVQPSEKPVEQRTVRPFYCRSRVAPREDFAFKEPKPVRQSRATFVLPCQVQCYSIGTLGLDIPHAPRLTGAAGTGVVLHRQKQSEHPFARVIVYFIGCLYDAA